jgi:3-methyladenine DNA glycosylase AlkD
MPSESAPEDVVKILRELKSKGNARNIEGMARFGIRSSDVFGVPMPEIRRLGRQLGKDHALAGDLWATRNMEARILASLVDEPKKVTASQMEGWVQEFDNWAICDGCCSNLFCKTPFAYDKALEWSGRDEEFVKRAGFSLMAALTVHDKAADDARFLAFLPAILDGADDKRNFVKKAVNWALRQIGKRNLRLNLAAVEVAEELKSRDSAAARWVAADAIRELTSDAVMARLGRRIDRRPPSGEHL